MHILLVVTLALGSVQAAPTQQTAAPVTPGTDAQNADAGKQPANNDKPQTAEPADGRRDGPDRIFGARPNYPSVDNASNAPPVDTRQTIVMAAYGSFDPFVFPFVAIVAGIAQATGQEASWGGGWSGYAKRYAMAF